MKFRVHLPVPVEEAFAWHERPGAFERLAPPWQPPKILAQSGTIHDGDSVTFRVGGWTWHAVHRNFIRDRQFQDVQERGPFHSWVHTHRFTPDGDRSWLEDDLEYRLPLGALGRAVAGRSIERMLARTFAHRHRVLVNDLARHHGRPKLRIAVTGSSGFLGSQLVPFLSTGGHEVVPILRGLHWDPARGEIDARAFENFDAVIHLAGENVGARWTRARKKKIYESRKNGTQLLAETLASLAKPPRVFVSASAIGYYGNRDADESSPPGDDFLSEVCVAWENAANPARAAGIRVVHPRIGVVLSPSGGALAKLLPPFRLGVGGRIGDGQQMMSWIALDDVIAAIHFLLFEPISGPVNLVAPNAVSNAEFSATLGRVLHRPAFLPLPAAAISGLFGEMGRTVLLGGSRVTPRVLVERGFRFQSPMLATALEELLSGSTTLESSDAPSPHRARRPASENF